MKKSEMTDTAANFWDVWIKAIGTGLTVITIVFGVFQFIWTTNNNATKERESRERQTAETAAANIQQVKVAATNRFWEKRLDVYIKISQTVGSIAEGAEDAAALKKARSKFLNLYWGEAVLAEDKATENAMVQLRRYLDIFNAKDPDNVAQLKSLCLDVTKSLRASIEHARSSGSLAD